MQKRQPGVDRGFTLVELITVIIIIGVIALVTTSKFFNFSTFEDSASHQEVLSAFRFAQKIAIASQNEVTVCLSDNGYDIYYSSGACGGSRVKRPDGQGDFKKTGLASIAPAGNYTYQADGIATPAGSFTVGGRTITIEPVTGYVHD
jgi:MSHA pilin protein MshC